jgi:hypothetical protein
MFGITCDCSYDGDFDNTLESEVMRTARRTHKCGECGRDIHRGERYEVASVLSDGSWSTYKTCLGCTRIRDRFCSHGWIWGGVAELVEGCIGFNYTLDPAELEDDNG